MNKDESIWDGYGVRIEDRERWARQLADIEAFEAGQAARRRREFWKAVALVTFGFVVFGLLGLLP